MLDRKSLLKYAVAKWAGYRAAAADPRAAPIFRFTPDGGGDYDNLLEGSRVTRNASLATGEATIVLDNTAGTWNYLHGDRTDLGDEGIVKLLLAGDTIKLFTGNIMEVNYDNDRVIIKLRDKLNTFLKKRIGSGQDPATVDGFGAGHLAWNLLTNEPPNGAGLDSTEDPSNIDINYSTHWDWRSLLNFQHYEVGAKITGHTVKWCLDRIAKMTNTYIWQGGDGRITFAPPRKNGLIAYSEATTSDFGFQLVTDTIVNDVTVYYNYDTEKGEWEAHIGTTSGSVGGVAGDSWTQYGKFSETDDNTVIWHNTAASALNQLEEQIGTYASPLRMYNMTAFLPAFEEDIASIINVTRSLYGLTGHNATIEGITFDLWNAQANIRARESW